MKTKFTLTQKRAPAELRNQSGEIMRQRGRGLTLKPGVVPAIAPDQELADNGGCDWVAAASAWN
jgi:hypothetical protein